MVSGLRRAAGYVVDERWGMTLGLMGQRVLARQECTRDDEWQLLHMVLIDLTTRAQVRGASAIACRRTVRMEAPGLVTRVPLLKIMHI